MRSVGEIERHAVEEGREGVFMRNADSKDE